eukprot:531871_1
MVSLPSEEVINVLLIDQLRDLCSKLNLHYEDKNRPSTLRKQLISIKNGKNTTKKTKSVPSNPKQSRNQQHRDNVKKKKRKKKRKRSAISQSDSESDTPEIPKKRTKTTSKSNNNIQINVDGLPNESFHPKVDFNRRNKRSVDFNCKLVDRWSRIHVHYRNRTIVAVVTSITIAPGLSSYNKKPILGEMTLTWNDSKCQTGTNPKGVCKASFDVLNDGTPQGFDHVTFITGSSEYTKYQSTTIYSITKNNQLYTATKTGKQITPLESTHATTIKNAITLVNDIIFQEQVTKDEIIELFKASKELNQMLHGQFFDTEHLKHPCYILIKWLSNTT